MSRLSSCFGNADCQEAFQVFRQWRRKVLFIAAVIGGYVFNAEAASGVEPTIFGVRYVAIFDYIGTIFLNALKMIIVPTYSKMAT